MTKTKKYSNCITIDDFIAYYEGASRAELRNRLKSLESEGYYGAKLNEAKALRALLS